jgi:uncharacterized protein YbaP (TraB family)
MTNRTSLTNELNHVLEQMGWSEEHPRVRSFLNKAAQKLNRSIFSTDELPDKYLNYLVECIKTFRTCQHLLQLLNKTWKDEDVLSVFTKYGNTSQIPLNGWTELYSYLDAVWFETSGGF